MPNNNLQPMPLALLTVGGILLYAAVMNKQPLELAKAILTGGDISKVALLDGGNTGVGPGAVPNSKIPGHSGDGTRTDPPGYNSNDPNTGILPILPGEHGGSGVGPVVYRRPFTYQAYI